MRSATLALGLIIALGWLPLDTTAATVAETHVQRIARGAARLTTFSNGTGTLYLNLKGLRPGRWGGQLQRGTCEVPGARVAVLAPIVVPSSGSVARTDRLTTSQARGRVLRLIQGSTRLCVTFGASGRTGVLAADAFDRKTAAGWDVAAAGGAYEPRAPGLRVDGAAGVLELTQPGANLLAVLPATSARDVSIRFRVSTDRPVAGDRQYVYGEARRIGEADAYRFGVRFGRDGTVAVQAGRVIQSAEVPLGREVQVPGVTHRAGVPVNVRGEVAGINPTRLRIRVWPDGRPEPMSWAYVATDWAPSLQRAGAVGLRAYLPRAAQNAPVLVRFDDLDVAGIVAPPVQSQPDSEVLIGAGDIAVCGSEADSATASLIRSTPGTVFTAGDNVYPNGTLSEFRTCYDPAWGSFRDADPAGAREPRLQHPGGDRLLRVLRPCGRGSARGLVCLRPGRVADLCAQQQLWDRALRRRVAPGALAPRGPRGQPTHVRGGHLALPAVLLPRRPRQRRGAVAGSGRRKRRTRAERPRP